MSRVPYEVHRARKRAGLSRIGSETPTETEYDFDGASSLASYSTHVTSSSYRPSSSSRAYGLEDSNEFRHRTLSPSSPQFPHQSPYPNSSYPTPSTSLPSRRYANVSEADPTYQSRASSSSLLPEASRRSSRPGETDEERRARREKRRAEKLGTEKDEVKRALRSSYKAKMKQEREEVEELKYGSPLRKFVKWSMQGGGDGSRSKGLSWGLGTVAALRVAIIGYQGIQEWRASSHRATPTANSLGGSAKPFFSQSQVRRIHDPALILEIFVLWSGVVVWSKMEGRRKGRSWRTQMTGILTILLQPILFSLGLESSIGLKLGLAVWALIYFSKSQDVRACIAATLLVGLSGSSEMAGWSLLGGLSYYALGKCVWLGGRRGIRHFLNLFSVVIGVTGSLHLIAHASQDWDLPSLLVGIRDMVVSDMDYRELSSGIQDNLRILPDMLRVHWMKYLLVLLTQLPPLIILIYTSISTRTTPKLDDSASIPNSDKESSVVSAPIITILPLTLLTSAIPIYLLSSNPSTASTSPELLFTLLPLTLMMCLRGDDDTWNVGVMMSNIVTFRMRHNFLPGSNVLSSLATAFALVGWNYLIGHSPRRMMEDPWLRRSAYVLYGIMSITLFTEFLSQLHLPLHLGSILPLPSRIQVPIIDSCLTSMSLWATWLWSIKKLLETAWAIGGFAGSGSGFELESDEREPRIIVQAPEA